MTVTASMVSDLRAKTGAGMMDCKRALAETSGDLDKAIDYLRTKGLSASAKKADRIAAEGLVQSYIHAGGKIGVLVEVNSETDFVARNPEFQQFVKDVAMHIAAASPAYVRREEVPADVTEKEKAVLSAQTLEQGKPANMIEKIVTGKIDKFYKDICLMEQPFVKDPDKSIEQIQTELVAKIGEKIMVRRFVRFALGEGIEKKSVDFAAEVAQQVASS